MFWSILALILILVVGLFSFAFIWKTRVEQRFPAIGKRMNVDGRTVHYLEAGQGKPIVLLHGASSNLKDWKASVFDRLAERYRVIAIDRPGYGWTDVVSPSDYRLEQQADFLRAVLEALAIKHPIILGHSFGTAVGFAHLARYPGEARGMVALSPVARPWFGKFAWHRELIVRPFIGQLFAWTLLVPGYLRQRDAAIRCMFAPLDPPPRYVERIGADLAYRPSSAHQNALEVVNSAKGLAAVSEDYSRIDVPVTAIFDRADEIVAADFHNAHLTTQIQQTDFRELPGTGHFAHHLAPEAVINAVDDMAAIVWGETPEEQTTEVIHPQKLDAV